MSALYMSGVKDSPSNALISMFSLCSVLGPGGSSERHICNRMWQNAGLLQIPRRLHGEHV